jgi:hypothetical protein
MSEDGNLGHPPDALSGEVQPISLGVLQVVPGQQEEDEIAAVLSTFPPTIKNQNYILTGVLPF